MVTTAVLEPGVVEPFRKLHLHLGRLRFRRVNVRARINYTDSTDDKSNRQRQKSRKDKMFIERRARKSAAAPQERHVHYAPKHAASTELGNIFAFGFYKHSAPTELPNINSPSPSVLASESLARVSQAEALSRKSRDTSCRRNSGSSSARQSQNSKRHRHQAFG